MPVQDPTTAPCYILIKQNNNDGDDNGWAWKQGDPVVVYGNGWTAGGDEHPSVGYFWVITISDKSANEIKSIVEDQAPDAEGLPTRLRTYRLDLNELRNPERNALLGTGFLTLTFQRAGQILRDMRV